LLGVDKSELRKVPYVENIPLNGRSVFLQPFLDKSDGIFKTFTPQGKKLVMIFAEPVQACYYAEERIDESSDIYIKLIDIVARHYSFEPVMNTLLSVIRDIENCSAVIEKYFVFLKTYKTENDPLIGNLVTTDLEYFFGNIRSVYDLLQNLVRDLWKRTSNPELPDSYYDLVKQDPEILKTKYNLPEPLIEYYKKTKDFFFKCRRIRDNILHRGLDIQLVFSTDDGFALQKNPMFPNPITLEFDIWPNEKVKKNWLVSVLALISHIIKTVIEDTDTLSEALTQSITPPTPISATRKLFLRGPYVHHLLKLEEYLEKQWVDLLH